MDISPHHDARPPQPPPDPSSPTPQSAPPVSNAQLAALLADAYRDNDVLRKESASLRKRAERAERIAQILGPDPAAASAGASTGGNATNGGGAGSVGQDIQQLQQKHAETVKRLVEDCDEQVRAAQLARDEAEARRRVAQDGWDQLERYMSDLELRAKDARSAFSRLANGTIPASAFALPGLPSPTGNFSASSPSSATTLQYSNMGPPGALPSRHASRHPSTRAGSVVFPVLPPHPNPNPTSTGGSSHPSGTRRPRTPSIDAYAANQPPTKRSRANADDQRGREPRTSYSESYISGPQHHEYQDPVRARQQHLLQRHPEARIIDRNYGSYQAHGNAGYPQHVRRRSSHSRSGSRSSNSSLDVDEMLLRATTGGEEHGQPGANGARYYEQLPPGQIISGRRRDGESPRPHGGATVPPGGHYSQPPSAISYPANQSTPGSLRNVQGSSGHVYTTHVFAPVVTGAPTKKTKYPNAVPNAGVPGSGPSIDGTPGSGGPATAPFAATNAQGQRICRQCGMVGRYKDNKCVEKWGPGPMGPGTVCDRCRKKMKRVERRGTLESQQLQNAGVIQPQQYQPRANSHAQIPSSSQGSDRSIQRSDTVLTNQISLGPSSFAQSRTERDEPPSSQSNRRPASDNTSAGTPSNKNASRQAPTPPAIAALREQDDDEEHEEDNENDPEQAPTSNIGRGIGRSSAPGSKGHSRSNSRNGRAAGNTNGAHAKKSSLSTASKPSLSPAVEMDVDEMDADADADAEAEAEAEILGAVDAARMVEMESENADGEGDADAEAELLEAVDAAEANSSSSGGERGWLKAEA